MTPVLPVDAKTPTRAPAAVDSTRTGTPQRSSETFAAKAHRARRSHPAKASRPHGPLHHKKRHAKRVAQHPQHPPAVPVAAPSPPPQPPMPKGTRTASHPAERVGPRGARQDVHSHFAPAVQVGPRGEPLSGAAHPATSPSAPLKSRATTVAPGQPHPVIAPHGVQAKAPKPAASPQPPLKGTNHGSSRAPAHGNGPITRPEVQHRARVAMAPPRSSGPATHAAHRGATSPTPAGGSAAVAPTPGPSHLLPPAATHPPPAVARVRAPLPVFPPRWRVRTTQHADGSQQLHILPPNGEGTVTASLRPHNGALAVRVTVSPTFAAHHPSVVSPTAAADLQRALDTAQVPVGTVQIWAQSNGGSDPHGQSGGHRPPRAYPSALRAGAPSRDEGIGSLEDRLDLRL